MAGAVAMVGAGGATVGFHTATAPRRATRIWLVWTCSTRPTNGAAPGSQLMRSNALRGEAGRSGAALTMTVAALGATLAGSTARMWTGLPEVHVVVMVRAALGS